MNDTPYHTLEDVLIEFPQRNPLWTALDSSFIAYKSEIGNKPPRDPWNREIKGEWVKNKDDDGNVVSVSTYTTVRGFEIRLLVIK